MSSSRANELETLQERLQYRFQDTSLLNTALTHTSFVKGDGKGLAHNERLEFLGDAVLELCITECIYKSYPNMNEGDMTRMRAAIVCESALYAVAKRMGLQAYLLLGHGEEHTGGRDKPSILSDAFEALLGALYLDGGLENARNLVMRFTEDIFRDVGGRSAIKDDKSILQEYIQKKHIGGLQYRLKSASGPDHNKVFTMQVYLGEELLGEGIGGSKQEAGQSAARQALAKLHVTGEE